MEMNYPGTVFVIVLTNIMRSILPICVLNSVRNLTLEIIQLGGV